MSLDGFIATKNDDISWLDAMALEGEDYGYGAFTSKVDTYIVGRKTYDVVMGLIGEFPQASKFDCYVLTRQDLPDTENITFYNGDIIELIEKIRSKPGGNIYCDGGGEIVKLLLDHDLIDEYMISIIPILLGDGKRLFVGETSSRKIKFVDSKKYESGLVQLKYLRDRS